MRLFQIKIFLIVGIIIVVLPNILSGFGYYSLGQKANEPLQNISSPDKTFIDDYLKVAKTLVDQNPDSVVVLTQKILTGYNHNTSAKQEADAYYYLGEALSNLNRFKPAIDNFKHARIRYKNLELHPDLALIDLRLGLMYYYTGNFELAINAYQQALEFFTEKDDQINIAKAYHNLGMVYNEIKDPNRSISYYKKAITSYQKTNDKEGIAALYQNIGVSYAQLNNDTKALENYQRSMYHYRVMGNENGVAITLVNIGNIHKRKKEYQEALDKFYTAVSYFEEQNRVWELMHTYLDMGDVFQAIGKYQIALDYLIQGLEMARENNFQAVEVNFYLKLSNTYRETGNYKMAYEYFKEYSMLETKIFRGENANRIKELEAKYNLEVKDRELAEKVAELQEQKMQKMFYFVGLFLLLILVVFFIYHNIRKDKERKTLMRNQQKLEDLVARRTAELKIEMTERRIAEESDKLKSAFLSNMSHEIRTPMNAIISFSNFLKDPGLDEERRTEYLGYIVSSGKTLLRLIDDIIDSAKIEANQLKIKKAPFNVNSLMRELYNLLKENPENSQNQQVEIILNEDNQHKNYIVKTDRIRLRQILTNLIDNALKYTEKGVVEFGFTISKASYLLFYVKDTGVGIPPEKAEKIFNRFSRISATNDKILSGTGLGLSICKDLVTLLGGKIWFSSQQDKGTTFYFTIPVTEIKETSDPEMRMKTNGNRALPYNWDSKLILVAEDDDLNFKILETIILRNNGRIVRATNGKLAVEYSRDQAFDLVLMDIQMPEMDGYQATREIKRMNIRIPVIAQTAFAMRDERDKCIEAGCDDYIAKPINAVELQGKISKYLC